MMTRTKPLAQQLKDTADERRELLDIVREIAKLDPEIRIEQTDRFERATIAYLGYNLTALLTDGLDYEQFQTLLCGHIYRSCWKRGWQLKTWADREVSIDGDVSDCMGSHDDGTFALAEAYLTALRSAANLKLELAETGEIPT